MLRALGDEVVSAWNASRCLRLTRVPPVMHSEEGDLEDWRVVNGVLEYKQVQAEP